MRIVASNCNMALDRKVDVEAGMARIVFIPANTPQARSEYVVLRMVGNVSQVSWKRFGSIRGLDWFDGEARKRADAYASM